MSCTVGQELLLITAFLLMSKILTAQMAELLENVEMEELKEEEVDKTVNTPPPSRKGW